MQVLIVEDERRLADVLGGLCREQRWQADVVYTGTDGLAYAENGRYDVVVLDVMLPGMDGFEVVRTMRRQKIATPVLMLTARDDVHDKVTGLDCGADDYMTKPFSPEELLARLRALTRRKGEMALEELCWQDLRLELTNYALCCGARRVRLGFKEFEVLRLLMERPGSILPKEELITRVWGAQSDAEDNNVEAYISFLRKKLHFLGSRVTIATQRKVGYRLEAES
ncbi:MAG: response regulator transcription factor [Gemmiger sp.]